VNLKTPSLEMVSVDTSRQAVDGFLTLAVTTYHTTADRRQTWWSREMNMDRRLLTTVQKASQRLRQSPDIHTLPPTEDNQIIFYCVPTDETFFEGLCDRATITFNGRRGRSIIKLGLIFFGKSTVMDANCGVPTQQFAPIPILEQQQQAQTAEYKRQKLAWLQQIQYPTGRHPNPLFAWTPPPIDAST